MVMKGLKGLNAILRKINPKKTERTKPDNGRETSSRDPLSAHNASPHWQSKPNTTDAQPPPRNAIDSAGLSEQQSGQSHLASPQPQPSTNDIKPLPHDIANERRPEPSVETEKTLSPAWRTAKAGAVLALELAVEALDGLPIPGAKGAISGLLKIIETVDKSKANMETLNSLSKHVTDLCKTALQPFSEMEEKDIPEDLKIDLEKLVSDLVDSGAIWTASADRGRLRRFADAKEDESDLKKFAEEIKRAVERFQLSGSIYGRLADAGQKQGLARIEAQMGANETRATMRTRTELINKLPRAREASFSSGRPGAPSSCFAGTRESILQTIKNWMIDKTQPNVFWLNGLAGIGKSTIAKTISEYAREQQFLGGSFFFSRGDKDLSDPTLVLPTLAFQLAQVDSVFKWSIGEVLEQNPDTGYEAAPTQLDKLIIGPLRTSNNSKRILLIVIDALDECAFKDKASEILQLLLAHSTRLPFLFRVFITSRPENHIRSVFNQKNNHARCILHDIEASVVRNDIHMYVKATLTDLPKKLEIRVGFDWPKEADLNTLVEKSGKLFVYAATAIKFISQDPPRNPQRHLEILLGIRQATNSKLLPYIDLDNLYLAVLRNALPDYSETDDVERFRWIIGCIVMLLDPLSVEALGKFTEFHPEDIVQTLYHLHSVIIAPSSVKEAPRLYHPSFRDFITERCEDPRFAVKRVTQEKRIVLRCFDLMMDNLKRDIANIEDYSLLNNEISIEISDYLTPEVQYSCIHWATHLLNTAPGDEAVSQRLDEFASLRLLYWFEAMSLLNATAVAVSIMRDVHRWVAQGGSNERRTTLLYDGYRFMLSHRDVIAQGALQVYRTGLPFTPSETLLYQTYRHEAFGALRVLHGTSPEWSPRLSTVGGRNGGLKSVTCSSTGQYIATGFGQGAVVVWEAPSCVLVMKFQHSGEILGVAFLPGGVHLVSASNDCSIYLWDILSSTKSLSFDGHTKSVTSLSVCEKTAALASASADATIRVWNTTTGICTAILQCNESPVHDITFLQDGSQNLLSGSGDGLVRLWDTKSPTVLRVFEGNTAAVRSVAVTNDGSRIASGSDDSIVKIFSMSNDQPTMTLEGHTGPINSIAFSPTDPTCLVSGGIEDTKMRVWNAESGKLVTTFRGTLSETAFTPDGTMIVTAYSDSTFRLWDIKAPPAVVDPDDHARWITSLAMSEDGTMLATGGDHEERVIKVWDAITGKCTRTLMGHDWAIYSLAFSSDGSKLASGSGDCSVRVWDVKSGETLTVLEGHDDYVKALNFSSSDLQVISRTNHTTFTWDLQSPENPIDIVKEENPNAHLGMGGYSKGFRFSMGDPHWLYMGVNGYSMRRVGAVLEEYRIGGFAFHSDRVVFTCVDGAVIILDISELKKEFSTPGDRFEIE